PFVPRLAADWLREAPSALARTFEGTLVFADVSGFTELTEKLAKRGREGAEEIAVVLDAAFAELITAAYAHHADLLKFGGDAVLLLFRGENHAHRAATAALGMQSALADMRRLSTSAGPVRLEMSVGMHAGTFHFFLVGGVHRELVVTGADASACIETEAIAGAGQVMMSRATAAQFDSALLGAESGGVVRLTGNPEAARIMPPFFDPSGLDLAQLLPASYTRELRGEPADPEHRHVAVAFVEIRNTDELLEREGPEALAVALEERITAIQESCLSFDVTFAQTDVSKQAVKAILLAGAPRSAGGDEEEIMLRAARAIVERPGTLPVRIGVNSGRVFAGIVGPPTRRTYTFYGDAINTAARIMVRAADGHLLVREDVLERARTTYELTPIEPFAAKGKAELVRASAVGNAIGERELEAIGPFVGREPELDQLLAALSGAREGRGALAIVVGEPGIGKTRLLGELRAHVPGRRAVRVQCAQVNANQPYVTAGQVILRALQLGPHAASGEVERRLREAVTSVAPQLEPWLPLLALVLGLDLPPTPETAALDERFVPERIATTVEALLGGLVPDAALVVIDDVHFMDEASVELIGRLARGIAKRRWLVVMARRAYDGGFSVPDGVEAIEVALGPLSPDASGLLVDQLTEDTPLPGHVGEGIVLRSAGSPLFITEMVTAVLGGADLEGLPRSIEALMAVQIDDLRSADRATLRRASVLGARFTRANLVVALGLDESAAEAAITRLDRFLVADGQGGLRFRHGLLRDAAYQGLSFSRRRDLHRGVALAIERDAGADTAAVADQLTRHFYEAGAWEQALRYGLVAGRQAQDVYANVDAGALLERAVNAGTRWRGARAEAVALAAEALGDVRLRLGELDKARSAIQVARRRVRGDVVEQARLLRKEATIAYRLGSYAEAQRGFARALRLLNGISSVPATAQRARIEAWLGVVSYFRGRLRDAVSWHERAIADGEAVGATKALAHALTGLDLAYNAMGEAGSAVHGPRALELYDELGDLVSKGGVLNNLGLAAYYAGRWDEAVDLYRQALDAWARAGDTQSVSMAAFNVGEILSAQGHLDEAEPLLRDAERASRAGGSPTDVAECSTETALLEARRGKTTEALATLDAARQAFQGAGDSSAALLVDARASEVLLLGARYNSAASLAEETLARVTTVEGGALVLPTLHRILGRAYLAAGRNEAARAAFEAAIGEAERVEHRYEEALALDGLAAVGDGLSPERHVRREGLFEQLGLVEQPEREGGDRAIPPLAPGWKIR
ncbi:MAG: adenylate/guanylate cyclase domain-containing protein, partial [Gaiella sp.]